METYRTIGAETVFYLVHVFIKCCVTHTVHWPPFFLRCIEELENTDIKEKVESKKIQTLGEGATYCGLMFSPFASKRSEVILPIVKSRK